MEKKTFYLTCERTWVYDTLIFAAGILGSYTYMLCGGIFSTAQTGNIVLMSSNLFKGEWANSVKYIIPIISFLLGTIIAEIIHSRFKKYEKIHWRQIVLLFEIVLMFFVGFMPQSLNSAANAHVSFVCALQVQTFHKVRGQDYASTMCIGNMRSGAESLYAYFKTKDKVILYKALTYFAVIALFALGAGIGSIITAKIGEKSVWICCGLLTISFVMMFVKDREKQHRAKN